jgi:hypothetical protein
MRIKPTVETMCCFLGTKMTISWCIQVKKRKRALFPISLLLMVCLIVPVNAFYFDFEYFETDKLVYEVGETINMVAKLTADFSPQGWCYVSFAVVTDFGPAFADEYFIPPSPDVRYLNSSYTISPDHTAPNITGVQSFVLFNVEIFDTVSQGAGDNIEITILRGQLDVVSVSSLSVQTGIASSLVFNVESVHNSNIVYANGVVNLHIENASSQTVLDVDTSTDAMGQTTLNWSDSFGPPGLYNLTVSSLGNEDFLPFSESFQVTVLPALSDLSIVSAPTSVHCQSPDGSQFDQADIVVEHINLDSIPVNDSLVTWETSFGNGLMTNQGGGQYTSTIPFQTIPGSHLVNITATNPSYQTAYASVLIDVLPNNLLFTPTQPTFSITRGMNTTIGFFVESEIDWNQSVRLQFTDENNEFSYESDILPGLTNYLEIQTFSDYSIGIHAINVSTDNVYYSFQDNPQVVLEIIGSLNMSTSIDSAFYGESLNFILDVCDDANETVGPINIYAYYNNSLIPFAAIIEANSSMLQSFVLPTWISPGLHNITIRVESNYYHHINQTMTVQVWMRTNITIVITLGHEINQNQSIDWRSSSGSIIRPPPIFWSGTTSAEPSTALSTSLDSCPRLSSGTNI